MVSERDLALDILTEHSRTGTDVSTLVRRELDAHPEMPLSERAFVKRLCEGTKERCEELDGQIRSLLKNPDGVIKPRVLWLLRMSVYQIYYMDTVPDHAACDEAVRLLKRRHMNEYTGFVNGVLRNICRKKQMTEKNGISGQNPESLPEDRKEAAVPGTGTAGHPVKEMSVTFRVPAFVQETWTEAYGEDETQELLRSMLKPRPVCIRFDERVPEDEIRGIEEKIRAAGGRVEKGRWNPRCRYLSHIPAVNTLAGFREGKWTVQDESSQLLAIAAAPEKLPGESPVIADVCAAPGGKCLAIASRAPGAKILASDISAAKTALIRTAASRMHCTNVEVREFDATQTDQDLIGKTDMVLCDVPCSGLGVMTRKRDIRDHISPEKVRSLISLQKKILKASVPYLKPGGILMYSTCTINPDENEKMVLWICRNLGFEEDKLSGYLPEDMPGIENGHLQLLPHIHGTDGFFMARLVRT